MSASPASLSRNGWFQVAYRRDEPGAVRPIKYFGQGHGLFPHGDGKVASSPRSARNRGSAPQL